MIAKTRTEYMTMCSTSASKKTVEALVKQLEEAILQEEMLKELGINVDDLLSTHF